MPPETRRTKFGFVAIGGLSVLCIIAAGIINSISQNRLNNSIETMGRNIKTLAAPANVSNNANVDQILAAAASKLMQQDKDIEHLKSNLNDITHPPDAFYLNDSIVARTAGNVRREGKYITFQLVISGSSGLDFKQTFRYQTFSLKCEPPPIVGQSGSFGVMDTRYPDVRCAVESDN